MYLKISKNKKSNLLEVPGFTIIELIMLVAFIMLAFKLIDDASESATYEKAYLARHFAILVGTMLVPGGDVEVTNHLDSKWFSYAFDDKEVQVYDGTQVDDPPRVDRTTYPILADSNIRFGYGTLKPENKMKKANPYNPINWFNKQDSNEQTSVQVKLCKQENQFVVGGCS